MDHSTTDRRQFTFLSLFAAISFLIWLSPLVVSAADWSAIWTQGGTEVEKGTEIAIDNNGSVYVAGWAMVASRGDTDLVVIKYGADGVQDWDYIYDGGLHNALGYDEPVGVGFDTNGNVYVSGKSRFERSGSQDYDYVTIKLDPDGTHVWTRMYDYLSGSSPHGDDTPTDMAVDLAGNVWITGDSDGDYLTVKYDADGNQVWANRYEGDAPGLNSMATAVAFGSQGQCYVTGFSQNPATADYDYVTIKYAAAGAELWKSRYGNAQEHELKPWAIAVDGNDNVAVTGRGSFGGRDVLWRDVTTVKYGADGQQAWADTFSGTGFGDTYHDEGFAVDFDSDGNLFVAGYATMAGDAEDYLVLKYSSTGVQQWMRNYNEIAGQVGSGESLDRAHDLAVDGAGRVHVVGGLDVEWGGVSFDQTYGIVTYANDGTLLTVQYFDNSPAFPLDDEALAVAVTQAGDVAVTGSAFGVSTFEDIGTVTLTSSSTDRIFADGFENGNLSAWSPSLVK